MPTAQEVKQEAKWQAEHDAKTLATANIILNNDKRLKAAKKAAKELAKEVKAEFEGMLKVANKSQIVEGMRIVNED